MPQRDLGVPTGISKALATNFKLGIQAWGLPWVGTHAEQTPQVREAGCCSTQTHDLNASLPPQTRSPS